MTEKNNNTDNTRQMTLANLCYVYAKTKWMQHFKAFDLNGFFVGNLIYASMVPNDRITQEKLQQIADDHASSQWQFQLRNPANKDILYETKLAA